MTYQNPCYNDIMEMRCICNKYKILLSSGSSVFHAPNHSSFCNNLNPCHAEYFYIPHSSPIHRGSYRSDHVLLNLLNELRKIDKMQGLPSIFSFSQ